MVGVADARPPPVVRARVVGKGPWSQTESERVQGFL